MKLSIAFKLLEDGEILTDGYLLFKLSDEGLIYSFMSTFDWNMSTGRIGQSTFENFRVYEKPKERVQYYEVFYLENGYVKPSKTSILYTSKEDFIDNKGKTELDYQFIQMIKVGDPI